MCLHQTAAEMERQVLAIEQMFRRPWTVVPRLTVLLRTLRRLLRARRLNPIRWWVIASANFHCFIWSSEAPSQARSYMAGDPTLDPQYFERPPDLSEAGRIRYFDPVRLTDAAGWPADGLAPYVPASAEPARRTLSVAGRADRGPGHEP